MSRGTVASALWEMRRQRGIFLLGTIAILGTLCGVLALASGGRWTAAALVLAAVVIALASLLVQGLGYLVFGRPFLEVQTALRRSEGRYRMLLEDASDIVLVIGAAPLDPAVTTAIAALVGRRPERVTRRRLLDIVHRDDRAAARRLVRLLSADNPKGTLALRLPHADGHDIRVDAILRRIEAEPGHVETVVTIRDVSARFREADELRQATLSAREAQSAADQANQAKTDFLACMSHEIRTPLNAVIGFADLLLARPEVRAPARLFGERIKVSADALLRVVDDILDFSQVEAGAIELAPAPFALPKLVDDCVAIVQQTANAKHLAVHVNLQERLPTGVLGDEARLRQILLNLLNNAIKFTHEGSILLDIRRDRSDPAIDCMRFAVIDSGIGIAREDMPRLFQRFAQADAGIRRLYGGNGLGLAISKRLVAQMGGAIGVDSEKGVGSTFWFTVPLQQAALPADATPRRVDRLAPKTILLVEDVAINQELARHILEAAGHTVDIVGNGAEAIMAAIDFPYDIVLMDIQMPHVDGLSATRSIRALAHPHRNVPIIGITADVLPEQTAAALEAGMIDIVHKPFAANEILAALGRVLGTTEIVDTSDGGTTLAKLARLIGEDKVQGLLASLAQALREPSEASEATPGGRMLLRRWAHARAPGAGMLGFTAFAAACRDLELAADDASFPAKAETLRRQARAVADEASTLANERPGLPGDARRLASG